MKGSKIIALSAVSAALAVGLLALGAFIEVIDISCVMFAGMAMMLPLSKKSYLGAFLAYLASAILSLILTGGRFTVIVPFAMFFGLYPIVNALQVKFNINKVIGVVVKDVWFLLSMFVYFKVLTAVSGYDIFQDFSFVPENLHKYLVPALFVLGAGFFIFYDFVMMKFQRVVDYVVERIKF